MTSDIRLKEKLIPVKDSLERLSELKAYNYYWKDKHKYGDKKQLGLVAQEVEKVFPEAIQKGKDGFLAVSYSNLIAPTIEAIKQLWGKVLVNDKKIAVSEKKIEAIEAQLKSTSRMPASVNQSNKNLAAEITELKAANARKDQEISVMKNYFCIKDPSAPFFKK